MRAEKIKLNNRLRNSSDMKTEARNITDAIHSLGDGINAVRVDPLENTITVDFIGDKVSLTDIERKLREENYL